MVNNVNIDQLFVISYRKFLVAEIDKLKEYITSCPLPQEDYTVAIGKLHGLTQASDTFEHIIKECFGQEY